MADSESSLQIYRRPKDDVEETKNENAVNPKEQQQRDDQSASEKQRKFLMKYSKEDIVSALLTALKPDEIQKVTAQLMSATNDGVSESVIGKKSISGHSPLALLGITDDDGSLERQRVALFASSQDGAEWNEDGALKRIKWMMRAYRRWLNMKEVSTAKSGRYGFVDAVTMRMTEDYQFNELLADFRSILKAKEVLIEDERTRTHVHSERECDAADCFILRRSEREKKESDGALSEWFFVEDDSGDFDKINNAVYQELLDSIHIFMEHTVRISPDELQAVVTEKEKEGVDDEDYDHFADSMCSVLKKKKNSSSRFRNNRRGGAGHKFMTTTVMDSHSQLPSTTVSKSTGTTSTTKNKEQEPAQPVSDHKESCFMDALCAEIEAEAPKETTDEVQAIISVVKSFVDGEGGDTDAVIEDLEKVEDSNILTKDRNTTNSVSVWSICQKFIAQTTGAKDVYSSGWRYFYWPFYANNEDEERVVFTVSNGTRLSESNPGYKLKDWFIPQKYQDLKDEALHNRCCSLSLFQWKMVIKKAQIKLEEWNKSSKTRKLQCRVSWWEIPYGITKGTTISLSHIIAILMYCNYTEASYQFSRTFRKVTPFESDRVLKGRHSEFSIWGKLLREAIECFGEKMVQRPDITVFYHGVNREMVFPGTSIKLRGPVSTTLDFIIASGSFGAEGIVVEIRRGTHASLWDCQYWSDFHEEAECLFVDGLILFNIRTIRHIPSSRNYRRYIVPMNMLAKMLRGVGSRMRMATQRDVGTLRELITEEIAGKQALSLQSQTDGYILRLFHYFCVHLEEVAINLQWMSWEHYKNYAFGFKIFRSLFFLDEDNESLNIGYFLQFLPKLKQFVVINRSKKKNKPSLSMTDSFMNRMLDIVQFVNDHKTLSKSFESLIVVESKLVDGMDRESFMMRYQAEIAQFGWKMENTEYEDPLRPGKSRTLKFQKSMKC